MSTKAKKSPAPKAPAKAAKSKARVNPFRPGSIKCRAYGRFTRGGERQAVIESIVKMGATPSTARTWYDVFRRVEA